MNLPYCSIFVKNLVFCLSSFVFIACSPSTDKPTTVPIKRVTNVTTDKIQLIDSKPGSSSPFGVPRSGNEDLLFQWQNDSTLYIYSTILITTTCGLKWIPHLHIYGSLIDLDFEFVNPSKSGELNKCLDDYYIEWHLKGIKKSDKYVYLINGCLPNNFNKKLVSSLFKKLYRLKESNRVVSALDNLNRKQGLYIKQVEKTELWYYYKDDILVDSLSVGQ